MVKKIKNILCRNGHKAMSDLKEFIELFYLGNYFFKMIKIIILLIIIAAKTVLL